jgi:hypothetical protein
MTELVTVRGPLDDDQIGWICALYGPTDPNYASSDFVRHQFVGNPFGWSTHAFAMDGGRAVGHTGVVPFVARRDGRPVSAGKIEAVVVAPSHRGTRLPDGRSLAVGVLETAYAHAHGCGIDLLFGLAPPRVAAVHERAGCRRLKIDVPTYVLVTGPSAVGVDWPRRRRVATSGLSVAQNLAAGSAFRLARTLTGTRSRPSIEPPTDDDATMAAADPGPGRWTISGDEAWSWYAGSGTLRALTIPGPYGSRALIRYREGDSASIQVVAWRPERAGLLPAVLLLGSARLIARRADAPTLRFQPWPGSCGNGELVRACRRLGLFPRTETELVLHASDPGVEIEQLDLTPFFYITF